MKKLLTFLVLAPLFVWGQGVHFESGLSWGQVRAKARAENKFIFVDCYASWCGPCKMMDRDVYPNDSVGEALNAHFVSVKVQMDTSKKDNDSIRAWYSDAHILMMAYKITAYPSFLFFSPDGEIVHRGLGYQARRNFINLAEDSRNPKKQYYSILAKYRAGIKDFAEMPYLASCAKSFNEQDFASSIASDYIHNYLNKLSDSDVCTPEHLSFIGRNVKLVSSKDKVFEILCRHPELANKVMNSKYFALRTVNNVIAQEEISPVTNVAKRNNNEPDWDAIAEDIRSKFGEEYVNENIVRAKVIWYQALKDWKNYTKNLVILMDIPNVKDAYSGIAGMVMLNNCAWDVFEHSENKGELEKAISWSDRAQGAEPKPTGNLLDTKANLLYKLGKKDEAISLEKRALELDPRSKDIAVNLGKMERDQPTWLAVVN